MENRYLNAGECAGYIKRSKGAVYNLVLRRKIPFHKPGGRILFDRIEIDHWVQKSGMGLHEVREYENN